MNITFMCSWNFQRVDFSTAANRNSYVQLLIPFYGAQMLPRKETTPFTIHTGEVKNNYLYSSTRED